ncbi:uromodulin-like [Melanotaenia boesemani]|uniref:uromodulin-like n=1 Tax=Melanotaenia boesemani TaxID=1250792 RepID=UPI001C044BA8|nr:uromodulin-like [Melanotaenia boesemani]
MFVSVSLSCLMNQTCTVTGPAVIDIHKGVASAEGRCSYTLVLDSWDFPYQFLANFRERRRKDVSFVDSVTLQLGGSDIVLGQGGRVLMGNSPLTLNSSVQEVHGVKLSKDQTGVHAQVSTWGRSASLFFDGNTAQIHIEVPVGSSLNGLCGSSNSFSSSKSSEYSSSSCDTVYSEAADSTIDCNVMTERCNILKEAPFSSCNTEVDPAPYITACNETLCKYPAVDGLRCQFLWAYARACSLSNVTLEGWWSEAECSSPEVFCPDKICSDHEFCGMKSSGDKVCLCRAVFASSYKDLNSLGDPTVCTQNSASVSLVGCLLEEKNIDYSLLHLNDESCKGEMDQQSHMVTFSFNNSNTCGAVIKANDSQITYKNTIVDQNTTSAIITRHDQFYIDFFCIHIQPEIKTMSLTIKDSSVVQHITSGGWNYTVTMKAYTNGDRTQALDSNSDVVLNQKIWVELDTTGLNAGLIAVVTDSCWATGQESSSSTPKHDLIKNSCANAVDQTVVVERNGDGTSSFFSFNMFKFTGSSTDVYLHCKLKLCVREGNSCIPDCSGGAKRRRRSVRYERGASAFVSMAWIN